MKDLEKRMFEFEVRAEPVDEGTVMLTGRPIVYNSRTDFGDFDEYIAAGALDGTDLTDVRFLINHDLSKIPLARSRRNNANSTMKFTVDGQGLLIDWVKLDVKNNAEARALASAVERGDINGMSFMFSIEDEKWQNLESDHPTKIIKKIGTVVEVSAVTFPAYADTSLEISKRNAEALDNARAALDSAREKARNAELDLLKMKSKILGGF